MNDACYWMPMPEQIKDIVGQQPDSLVAKIDIGVLPTWNPSSEIFSMPTFQRAFRSTGTGPDLHGGWHCEDSRLWD